MPTDALECYPFDQELISATPEQFNSQMRYIREHRQPISLQDVIRQLEEGIPLPPFAVAVTFDDGFSDTYRYAFPILKRYSIPATIFVSTGYVESQQPFWFELAAYLAYRLSPHTLELHDGRSFPTGESHNERTTNLRQIQGILKDLPNRKRTTLIERWTREFTSLITHDALQHSRPISWSQIQDMASSGMEFGSHTVTHPNLTRLSDSDLTWELKESKRALETRLQRPIESIAYPIGTMSAFNDRITAATAQHGFKLGVTYIAGANRTEQIDQFKLRRHGIGLRMTPAYFKALMTLPSWLT